MEKRKGNTAQTVYDIAKPLADELGLDIWDVIYKKEGADWYLRILIDKEDGITIDDCVDMTHAITPMLDKKDPISQEYMLEVSSPGINRKLTKPEHFEKYIGDEIRVKLIRPLKTGEKVLDGELIRADKDEIELKLDEDTSVTIEKKEFSSAVLLEDDFA